MESTKKIRTGLFCLAISMLASCVDSDSAQPISASPKPESSEQPELEIQEVAGKTLLEQFQKLIFEPQCGTCHSGDPAIPLNFSTLDDTTHSLFGSDGEIVYAKNSVAAQNGWQIIKPGQASKSFLIRKMDEPGIGEGSPMPNLKSRIPETTLQLLSQWIDNGADINAPPITELKLDTHGALNDRVLSKLVFEDPQENCANCHPKHVEQWEISNHAYAAVDPVFLAMSKMGQRQTKGKMGQFCMQCHSPVGFVANEVPAIENPDTGIFEQNFDNLSPIAQKGVSCDVCHSITDVIEPLNARMSMTPNGVKLATIQDPEPTDAHDSAYSALHGEGEVCAACHNVVNPRDALIEETFTEWQNSSFAQEGENKKTCQTCHMPASEGPAATDGPIRTIHDHTMVGVDVSLLPPEQFPGYYELREASAELLRTAANLDARFIDDQTLEVSIENLAGHALPSGATAERQMWLAIQVTDAGGNLIFESGMLDSQGDLMDGNPKHTLVPDGDPQLVKFAQDMLDVPELTDDMHLLDHVVAMPWQAAGVKNHLIGVEETATFQYDLSQHSIPVGSKANIQLKFRSFPMYFLRLLEVEADLDPDVKTRVPIVIMQEKNIEYETAN